jgi:putative DNA primase/helicase
MTTFSQVPEEPEHLPSSATSGAVESAAIPTPAEQDEPVHSLDQVERLDPKSFPHQPLSTSSAIPATIPNVAHLLGSYGIVANYDAIKKHTRVVLPRHSGTADNANNVAMTVIISLANLNGIPAGQVPAFVEAIADRNQINPVADWIISKPWDGQSRLPDFYATLVQRPGFPEDLKQTLMRRWLLSAVAAAFKPHGFRCRGVLTLQGPQSIGKTAWVAALVTDSLLGESVIRLDHHLDGSNKDSIITAITHWIVEIGELDSSFRKDIARLKGFLTADQDKIRRPYAKADSEYPRRTVFCATVNDGQFLPDITGNTRWWTIPVVNIDFNHGIDMQQLFAEVYYAYCQGDQWWLTPEEERLLEAHNLDHRATSVIRERILAELDLDRREATDLKAMTPTQLLRELGIDNPTNAQAKECGAVLRDLLGEPKKINGQYKWRIPLASPRFPGL